MLIPTVAHDGSGILSDQAALDQYRTSGKHLGIFDSSSAADDFAQRLHQSEARVKRLGERRSRCRWPAAGRAAPAQRPMLGQTPQEIRQNEEHWDAA